MSRVVRKVPIRMREVVRPEACQYSNRDLRDFGLLSSLSSGLLSAICRTKSPRSCSDRGF